MLAWRSFIAVLAVVLVAQTDIVRAQQLRTAVPVFSPTGPDAEAYGEKLGYPIGLPLSEQRNMIGNFSHADQLAPTHTIAAAEHPLPLLRAPCEISVKFTFGAETASLPRYRDTNPTTGLLIAHNDTILSKLPIRPHRPRWACLAIHGENIDRHDHLNCDFRRLHPFDRRYG